MKTTRLSIYTLSIIAVLYPLWVRFQSLNLGGDVSLTANIFPMLGLAAFALLWLHMVGPAFEPWLSTQVNFMHFLKRTQPIILALILLHPLLLFVTYDFHVSGILASYGLLFIRLGGIGLFLLLTFDVGTLFRKSDFIEKHWNKILIISTIGFIIIFFHSLALGSDLQSGLLRKIWIFYGVSAILSAVYVYGLKRFFIKD